MAKREEQKPEQEEDILKMIIEKESWEDVIYYIVSLEQLNPWDVNLVKLTESFIEFVKTADKDMDFRIPAKVVFVAAILLRLKADYLSIFEEEEEEVHDSLKEEKPFAELGIDPNLVQLGYPMKRVPKRQVTLEELIAALRNALEVRDRKEKRIINVRRQLAVVAIEEEEDITVKTEKMMKEIDDLMQKLKTDKVEFSDIVKDWRRDKIVDKFVPLLHLENSGYLVGEQEEFFKEILISKKKTQETKS